jgi:hypothetical protein
LAAATLTRFAFHSPDSVICHNIDRTKKLAPEYMQRKRTTDVPLLLQIQDTTFGDLTALLPTCILQERGPHNPHRALELLSPTALLSLPFRKTGTARSGVDHRPA